MFIKERELMKLELTRYTTLTIRKGRRRSIGYTDKLLRELASQ